MIFCSVVVFVKLRVHFCGAFCVLRVIVCRFVGGTDMCVNDVVDIRQP